MPSAIENERGVVRAFPLGRRLTSYVAALTRKSPGVIHFRTGAGRILRDLMLHWPIVKGHEDDALEMCERISEAVYPLTAALYAQAVDIAATISARPLPPPAMIQANATYLVFDGKNGVLRTCTVSPAQPLPDADMLGAPQGIALLCSPLNYRYHTIKDDRKRVGHPHAGIFELSQRLINELYELPPFIAPEQKIAATLITKIQEMPKAVQRAEVNRAANLARPLPHLLPVAPVIAAVTSLSALPPAVRALERRIMTHALDKNLSQDLRAGLRQTAQTLRAAWPQATIDEAARRETEPPLNPSVSAVAHPARAASPAPQATPVVIPSPLPPRAVPPPVFAPQTAISIPPSVVVAATYTARAAPSPAAPPAAPIWTLAQASSAARPAAASPAPALNAPQTKAAEVSPPRRTETATPQQERPTARYNQTNDVRSPAPRQTERRKVETPSARPEAARTPDTAPSRRTEAQAQQPRRQPAQQPGRSTAAKPTPAYRKREASMRPVAASPARHAAPSGPGAHPVRPTIEPARSAGVHPLGTPTLVEREPAPFRRGAAYRVGTAARAPALSPPPKARVRGNAPRLPSGQPAPGHIAHHVDTMESRQPNFYESIKIAPQAALWSRPVIGAAPAVGKLYKNAVFPAAAPPRGPAAPALKGFTAMSALLRATLPTPEPAPMPHWGPPRGRK